MSVKSIILSIITLVISAALFFAVAWMFAINIVLGIVGIILWGIALVMLRSKALNAATGLLDRLFAKYAIPILNTFVIVGMILFVFIPGAFNDVFWFLTG